MAERAATVPDAADAQQVADAVGARLWSADAASQALGMRLLQVAPGTATLEMAVRADMLNGFGTCHGGVITALADSAFAFACNSHGETTVASGLAVDFVKPARAGDRLSACAVELHRGRGRSGLYDIAVTNQAGELVASVRGRSHRVGRVAPDAAADPPPSA